jgi:hypothetical protein
VEFSVADASAVVEMVRTVAESRDGGVHGHGVEVVIEAPRLRWLARLRDSDGRPDQARIAVTKFGGEVAYPFDVLLITGEGGRAAQRVPVRPGWARSSSAGLAYVIQKGRPGAPYSWGDLVGGAVGALLALRDDDPVEGWRAAIDRGVHRR